MPRTDFAQKWLRWEAAAELVAFIVGYRFAGGSWLVFGACFLLPDIAIAGYWGGKKAGAYVYNSAHTYAAPALLATVGLASGSGGSGHSAIVAALLWAAHIAFDRALGFGLKYPAAFKHTHLNWGPQAVASLT